MGAGSVFIIVNNLTPWGLEGERNETETCGKIKHECYETAKWKCLTENLICPCNLMVLEAGRKSSSAGWSCGHPEGPAAVHLSFCSSPGSGGHVEQQHGKGFC